MLLHMPWIKLQLDRHGVPEALSRDQAKADRHAVAAAENAGAPPPLVATMVMTDELLLQALLTGSSTSNTWKSYDKL